MSRDLFTISVDERLANLHKLTTRPKMLANWTETTGWRNDHKPNPSWFIVTHSPWDSTIGCSSTRLDRPRRIPYPDDELTHEFVSLSDHLFDLCRTTSLHPSHKPNHLEPIHINDTFRYFSPDGNAEMWWNITTCRPNINTRPSAIFHCSK